MSDVGAESGFAKQQGRGKLGGLDPSQEGLVAWGGLSESCLKAGEGRFPTCLAQRWECCREKRVKSLSDGDNHTLPVPL